MLILIEFVFPFPPSVSLNAMLNSSRHWKINRFPCAEFFTYPLLFKIYRFIGILRIFIMNQFVITYHTFAENMPICQSLFFFIIICCLRWNEGHFFYDHQLIDFDANDNLCTWWLIAFCFSYSITRSTLFAFNLFLFSLSDRQRFPT